MQMEMVDRATGVVGLTEAHYDCSALNLMFLIETTDQKQKPFPFGWREFFGSRDVASTDEEVMQPCPFVWVVIFCDDPWTPGLDWVVVILFEMFRAERAMTGLEQFLHLGSLVYTMGMVHI